MSYLAAVCHDLKGNTLEATWIEDTGTELKRVRCHNYSPSQAEDFRADVGNAEVSQRYIDAAGWTREYVAAYTAEQERLAAEVQAKADEEARITEEARLTAEQDAFDAEVERQAAILRAAQALVKTDIETVK